MAADRQATPVGSTLPRAPRSWRASAAHADALLATLAFPKSRPEFADAERAAAALCVARGRMPARLRRRGDDSGHDGSTTRHCFDLGIAEWLVARFPGDVEIDWRDAGVSDALDALLRPVIARAEEDGFDSDTLSMRAWLRVARGDAWPSDLAWVLDVLRRSGDPLPRRAADWERAALPIVWRLREAGLLRARLPVDRPAVRARFRDTPARPARLIAAPLRRLRLLPPTEADRVIAVSRETLAVRCREVHAISHANRNEVWLADLGAGTSLAVIGVVPPLRLSLEANYGFVLFANGVPVGYGGVSPLFRQANTGINIFAPFRGTEAGMLWVRALQAFHALFGSRRFIASPFQIGGGNSEALRSGAFWFYHRLGFRPSDPAVAALADAEAARRRVDRSYRSPLATLKRLAGADLRLDLASFDPRDAFDERWLAGAALRGTARIADEGRVARRVAVDRVAARLARTLGVAVGRWTADERDAFARLAPVAASIPSLDRWSSKERRALAGVLAAKGGQQERGFVLAASGSPRFFRSLAGLCRDG